MKKRDELRNKELLQAIEQSKHSLEEIIDFLNTDVLVSPVPEH